MKVPASLIGLCLLMLAAPVSARDSLGIFSQWGAFRDPSVPRCYAIAKADPSTRARDYEPFATIGTWPNRAIRNQLHFRLSRRIAPNARISLRINGRYFQLDGGGGDAWAKDRTMDAGIVSAMRSARSMTINATDTKGRRFFDSYPLAGAATAMDAATVGCSKI